TGRPPFKAATPLDTMMQVVSEDPVPVRALQPQVPRDLETICLTCLRKAPGERYSSAWVLADDLRRYLADEPIRARRVSRLERLWKRTKRRPALVLLLILAFVTVANSLVKRDMGDMDPQKWQRVQVAEFGATLLVVGLWLYRRLTARLREAN